MRYVEDEIFAVLVDAIQAALNETGLTIEDAKEAIEVLKK